MNCYTKRIQKLLPNFLIRFLAHGTLKTMDKWDAEKLIRTNMRYYKKKMGYNFDINKPKTFTEKIQWYKFFYHNPLCPYIVDKVTFKTFINEKLGNGYVIPLYGSWETIEDLEREWYREDSVLPQEFCLKSNLQSDGRCIKIIHDKSNVEFRRLKQELKLWLEPENTLLNSADCNFYRSTPQILAEKYMTNFDDQLYDYKFFCFDGKPFCMYVATNHFEEDDYPITFYDLNWNKMDVKYGGHKNEDVPVPAHFEEMKYLAEVLSKDFPFVRVDFFDTEEKLYLAELTFNPGGGFVAYEPESFNIELGNLFHL